MAGWPDWDGDGKISDSEKMFSLYMLDEMSENRRGGKSGCGCLGCTLLLLLALLGSVSMIL